MTEAKLTIGHIAQAAGVHVEAVRYYQRRGLVGLPPKCARGFRYYTPGPQVACASSSGHKCSGCHSKKCSGY